MTNLHAKSFQGISSGFTPLEGKKQRRRMPKGKISLTGFVLLEVLVSVIVLTMGLLAVLGAFSSSSKIIVASGRYQTALQLAEKKMYEIESAGDDEIRDYGHGDFGDKYADYTWEYDIKEQQSEFYGNQIGIVLEPDTYKMITLSVSYKERGKTLTPITLVTYKTSKLKYLI